MIGVDYAWQKPTPAAIKAAGYSFVMRYLSPDSTKNLTATERDALHAQGISIGLVWEYNAQRAGSGFSAGLADAQAANNLADALGMPADLPIFYAVDYAANPKDVEPYFIGASTAGGRPVSAYGSLSVVDYLLERSRARYGWQACAWSNGMVSTRAHLYQRLHPTVAHPLAGTDENVVLHDFPLWGANRTPTTTLPGPASPIPTIPPEDDVPYSETQLEQFAGIGVHGQKIGRSDVTIGQALEISYKGVATLQAQIAALTDAVKQLASSKGASVDLASITAAAEKAVRDVLGSLDNTTGGKA